MEHVLKYRHHHYGTTSYNMFIGKVTLKFTENVLNSVSAISRSTDSEAYSYLATNTTFSNPFMPTDDSHPATKKYVDNKVSEINNLKTRLDGTILYITNNGTEP